MCGCAQVPEITGVHAPGLVVAVAGAAPHNDLLGAGNAWLPMCPASPGFHGTDNAWRKRNGFRQVRDTSGQPFSIDTPRLGIVRDEHQSGVQETVNAWPQREVCVWFQALELMRLPESR